jgi:hypothetical protein
MKIVKVGPYVSKGVLEWWEKPLYSWPIVSITRWWNYRRLGHNLEKAFQKSVAEVTRTGKNIEQLNEERNEN